MFWPVVFLLTVVFGVLMWRAKRQQQRLLARLCAAAGLPSTSPEALQAALRESRQQREQLQLDLARAALFEGLLGEVPQGLALLDAEVRVIHANPALGRLFGCGQPSAAQTLVSWLRHHEVQELALQVLAQEQPKSLRLELPATSAQAGGLFVLLRMSLMESAACPQARLLLWAEDITDAALNEQIRRDFVANASHELRTPLTLIQGYLEYLDQEAHDPQAVLQAQQVMNRHCQRMVRLVEDMLSLSKWEGSGSPLEALPIALVDCWNLALERLQPMMEERQVEVSADFGPEGCRILGDRSAWEQVFTNLLENSLKENPGRALHLSAKVRHEAAGTLHLEVADNGIGIAAHDLPFIFRRFFRGRKDHGQQIPGTGLGLSIVRHAVEAHGGQITARSTPGVETVFEIHLPVQASAQAQRA
jgi:signal transduction histidine kinase